MIFLDKTLPFPAKNATLNEQGAACCKHGDPSNRNQHIGGARMADNGQYTDSVSASNLEHIANFSGGVHAQF